MPDAGRGNAPARQLPLPLVSERERSCRHRSHRHHRFCLRCRFGTAPAMAQILPIRFQEHFQVRPGLLTPRPGRLHCGSSAPSVSRAPGHPTSPGTRQEPLTGRLPKTSSPWPSTPTRVEATQRTDSGRLAWGGGGAGVLVGVEARRPVQWEGAVARTCGPARCAGRRNPLSGSDDSPSWAAPTSMACRLRAPGDGNRRSAEMSPFSAYGSFNQTDERCTRILVASFVPLKSVSEPNFPVFASLDPYT